MAHENRSMRLTGSTYLHRIVDGVEQNAIGPLNADVLGMQSSAEAVKIPDKRRGRRGQNMKVFIDPTAPTGSLTLYSVPPRVLAMLMLGRLVDVTASPGTASGEVLAVESDYWTDLSNQNVSALTLVSGVRATLATGVVLNNNAITWTAKAPGTGGNAISVALINPGTNNAALAVTVATNDITVNLATDGSAAIASTAAEVLAAIEASAAASALVTVTHTDTSTGAAEVVAAAKASLASGANTGGTTYVVGQDYEINALLGKIRPLEGGALTDTYALASYTYAGLGGEAIETSTDYNVRVRILLEATNDSDDATMIWEAYSAILTPNGELDFMSADPIKAEFSMEFETPDGKDHPSRLYYVDNAA